MNVDVNLLPKDSVWTIYAVEILDMMNAKGNKNPMDDNEGYVMRGFNLWDQFYTRYVLSELNKAGLLVRKVMVNVFVLTEDIFRIKLMAVIISRKHII